MKRFFAIAVTLAAFAMPVSATTITDVFTSFYSFGDSLTDDGKFVILEPPSFDGRFTTGLTWSEYIEEDFEDVGADTRNYALGGATASPTNPLNPVGPLGTLEKQISAFTLELLAPLRDPGANPLVSLWFGANDVFTGQSASAAADFVADGVRAIADLGVSAGTTFDDFLLTFLPSIPGFPGAAEVFNTQLALNITGLTNDGFNIITYDPQDAADAIIADALFNGSQEYGITELIEPCAISFTDGDLSSCLDDGKDPDTFFFADSVHPTAPVHLLTSQQVTATIEASLSAVPLPAGLPLLFVGVGALGVMRFRRRAA
ncbi:MAG: SGNH/GDSL hydrolase family protein [Pseudomonadota bacterium]